MDEVGIKGGDESAQRFNLYGPAPFVLASRLASYPSEVLRQDILEILAQDSVNFLCAEATEITLWEALRLELTKSVESSLSCSELASRYIDLFDRGATENSLYETEYGLRRSQLKTGELADIAGFYQAFGFQLSETSDNKEMLDHIAVECEFYALLLAKQALLVSQNDIEGAEIVLDARRKFLQDHLGRYPNAIASRPGVVSDPLYSLFFRWCADLITRECHRLDVGVVPVDYQYANEEEAQMACASTQDIVSHIGGARSVR